jgi:hypothetical protein
MSDPGNRASRLPDHTSAAERDAYVVERVEAQFRHFHSRARGQRAMYFAVKIIQILLAAAVPAAASAHAPVLVTGGLGVLIVVLEGIQQLFQWHANWIRYRTTAEVLRRELFMFRALVGDYAKTSVPVTLLAERMDHAASVESAGWSTTFSAERGKDQ